MKKIPDRSGLRYETCGAPRPNTCEGTTPTTSAGYSQDRPEHTQEACSLKMMMKPGIGSYERSQGDVEKASKEAGKEQYLIPSTSSPPTPAPAMKTWSTQPLPQAATTSRLDQVQTPAHPMAMATTMYSPGKKPPRKVSWTSGEAPKPCRQRWPPHSAALPSIREGLAADPRSPAGEGPVRPRSARRSAPPGALRPAGGARTGRGGSPAAPLRRTEAGSQPGGRAGRHHPAVAESRRDKRKSVRQQRARGCTGARLSPVAGIIRPPMSDGFPACVRCSNIKPAFAARGGFYRSMKCCYRPR